MKAGPYAPPKSEVRDVQPAPPGFRVRTKTLYSGMLLILIVVALFLRDMLLRGFAPPSAAVAAVLAVAIVTLPLRRILFRSSGPTPWWWDVLLYALVAAYVFGAILDNAILLFIGFVPVTIMTAVFLAALWWVEAKYPVRAYSSARAIIFVPRDVVG